MQTVALDSGPPKEKITQLRALLRAKFPASEPQAGGDFRVPMGSGLPALELRRGAVTEAYGSLGSGTLLLESLIAGAEQAGTMAALVDGAGAFDPAQCGQQLGHLLCVMCKDAQAALKVADLLLRDGNIPLIVLDLQMNRDLRRIPATTWYRFQRIIEPTASALVVLTSRPIVSSAAERVELHNRWTLEAMRRRRTELQLVAQCLHRRAAEPRRIA